MAVTSSIFADLFGQLPGGVGLDRQRRALGHVEDDLEFRLVVERQHLDHHRLEIEQVMERGDQQPPTSSSQRLRSPAPARIGPIRRLKAVRNRPPSWSWA
jgi:hypothetical protein